MSNRYPTANRHVLLSIIIPVHNQSAFTHACLLSIWQNPPSVPFEIIVVNDGSTDDTTAVVADFSALLPVRLVDNHPPHRFARACNRGAAEAAGELLLFLNNDTELLPGWWEPLYRAITGGDGLDIVAPMLLFPDGAVQHCGKVWADIDADDAQPFHLYYRFPQDHPAVGRSREFQTVTGACILIFRERFLQLGVFDETYINGWEDDDLCFACRATGGHVRYVANSRLIHHQNQTLNERIAQLQQQLPSREQLQQLDTSFASGLLTDAELQLARCTSDIYQQIEQELLTLQQRFRHNRSHFFSKWAGIPYSDLLSFCREDQISPFEAIRGQTDLQTIERLITTEQQEGGLMVSIIILTYNRLDVTKLCLESIRRHTPEPHEIIIIDNGSTDGSRGWLRERATLQHGIRLVENRQNLGFAAGCNQGMRLARGDYLLLLNNDTMVTEGWLSALLEPFADPGVGIVGPMTNSASGIQQWPCCNYGSLQEFEQFAADFRQNHRFWWIPTRRVVGFCMLFRRSLMEQIGLLDEQFGSGNFEDDDYSLRAALAGYRNLIVGDLFIHHEGSATFDGNRINYREALLRNQAIFNDKWSRPVVDQQQGEQIIRLKVLEGAEKLCNRSEYNNAVEMLLQEGIGQLPEEPLFYHAVARILLDTEMYQDALDLLQEAPDTPDTSLLTVRGLIGCGRLTDAATLLEQPDMERSGAEYLALLGMLSEEWGNPAAALQLYQQALQRWPVCHSALIALARHYRARGDKGTALQLLERSVASGGASTLPLYHSLLATEEELCRGERFFSELRHCYPDRVTLTDLHIDLLLRAGRQQEGMDAILKLLVATPRREGLLEAALAVREAIGPLRVAPERHQRGEAVTLAMIMKDEEQNLARALASALPLVDEVVVVDTGSSDRSCEIALAFGALLIREPWQGDYSAPRNSGIKAASGNWILSLDADELISPLDYQLFRQLVRENAGKKIAFTLTTRNYTARLDLENWQPNRGEYPDQEAGRGWMPSDKVRLFPNLPTVRFENPIHEMVEPSLAREGIEAQDAPVVVHHYGYLDDTRQARKKEYYFELGKRKYEESGGAPHALVEFAIQAAGTRRYDLAQELWQKALELDPDSWLAWFNLGYSCLQKGEFQRAIAANLRAMQLRENYREAATNCAISQLAIGDISSAWQLVNRFLQLNQDYPTLHLLVGVIFALQGRDEESLERFRLLLEQNVEFRQFIHEVTLKLLQGGEKESASRLVQLARQGGFCMDETLELLNL